MSLHPDELLKEMLSAATGAAKGHAADLKTYIQARTKLIADGILQLAADRISPQNPITDDDVKFGFQQIKESEQTFLLSVKVTLRAAAQDAVNAALSVAADAINQAIGIVLL